MGHPGKYYDRTQDSSRLPFIMNQGMQPIAGEPFPGSSSRLPRHIELMRNEFALKDVATDMWAVTRRECVDLQARDNEAELLEKIYTSHDRYQGQKSLVLVEGTHEGTGLSHYHPWHPTIEIRLVL